MKLSECTPEIVRTVPLDGNITTCHLKCSNEACPLFRDFEVTVSTPNGTWTPGNEKIALIKAAAACRVEGKIRRTEATLGRN